MNRILMNGNGSAPHVLPFRKPGDDLERLLNMKDVARRLGIRVRTLYRWIDEKNIPVFRISSRALRITVRALNEWIEQQVRATKGGQP